MSENIECHKYGSKTSGRSGSVNNCVGRGVGGVLKWFLVGCVVGSRLQNTLLTCCDVTMYLVKTERA